LSLKIRQRFRCFYDKGKPVKCFLFHSKGCILVDV
jgi:hypothetical protein